MIRVQLPAVIVGLDEKPYDFHDRQTGERISGVSKVVSLSIGGGTPVSVKVKDDGQWLDFRHLGFMAEVECVFAFEPIRGRDAQYRMTVESVTQAAKTPAAASNGKS